MKFDFLVNRQFIAEEMDDFSLQGEKLESTLSSLSRINKYLGNSNSVIDCLKPIIRKSQKPLRIVDIGCGGGDLLREIADDVKASDLDISLIGIDGNANITSFAAKKHEIIPFLRFQTADILDEHFELPECDILISSHFMYHFTDLELSNFLLRQKHYVKSKIIISELQRSVISYRLFQLLGSVLFFPKMIMSDGLKAISRSFRKEELVQILHAGKVEKYTISWKWAFRYLVEIDL